MTTFVFSTFANNENKQVNLGKMNFNTLGTLLNFFANYQILNRKFLFRKPALTEVTNY